MTLLRFVRLLLLPLIALATVPSAFGWGCEGHQITALIAEIHLNPRARTEALRILAAAPIDPSLSRYCKQSGLDPFADDPFAESSTWADDERTVHPETAPWHFIDIPRGARQSDLAKYCPPASGCVTRALSQQVRILRNRNATPQSRADALRFVIHFVGDIHQPLHASTNNDRGGNCVPVAFFDRAPHETNPRDADYAPNLHEVWDVEIIERFAQGRTPQGVAREIDAGFHARILGISQPSDFSAWAWESHRLAEQVAYGQLPVKIAIESPREVESCADDNHISDRMLQLNEHLDDDYQNAAAAVAQSQLAKAGLRLAALLNSIWP
jgi:S1/P1 Nuclease